MAEQSFSQFMGQPATAQPSPGEPMLRPGPTGIGKTIADIQAGKPPDWQLNWKGGPVSGMQEKTPKGPSPQGMSFQDFMGAPAPKATGWGVGRIKQELAMAWDTLKGTNPAHGLGASALDWMAGEVLQMVGHGGEPTQAIGEVAKKYAAAQAGGQVPTMAGLKQFGHEAATHPIPTIAGVVRGALEDPELLAVGGVAGGEKAIAAASKFGSLAGRAAKGAVVGAKIGGAAAGTAALAGVHDPLRLAKIGAMWGGPAGLLSMLKRPGMISEGEIKSGQMSKTTAQKILDELGPKAGDATVEEVQAAGTRDIRVLREQADAENRAQQRAYDLMHRGASTKEVEATIKKNPRVGQIMEDIRTRRAQAAEAFDRDFGARQGEVTRGVPPSGGALGGPKPAGTEVARTQPRYQRFLPAIAAVGTGLALAQAYPDQTKKLISGGLVAGAVLSTEGKIDPRIALEPGAANPLGVALKGSHYTFKTLERLPQNRFEFPKQMILDQAKRQDVSGAERDSIGRILDSIPGDTVKAQDLVRGLKEETGDHELEHKAVSKWSYYGLSRIGRLFSSGKPVSENWTNLYRLPEHMMMSDANHFGDERLFGWTRSFNQDGVEHVVEIQSDLAQHTKPVPEMEMAAYRGRYNELKKVRSALNEYLTTREHLDPEESEILRRKAFDALGGTRYEDFSPDYAMYHVDLQLAELSAKMEAGAASSQLAPMLKHWYRRLIREELARNSQKGVVRFATADTVAKVEDWPRGENGQLRDPGHQSIYNRYQKEVEKFLKNLGGKPYTDPAGHTWIDVPTQPFKGRIEMYGAARPELLAGIALTLGGAAVTSYFAPRDKLSAAIAGGAAGLVASFLPGYIRSFKGQVGRAAAGIATIGGVTAGLAAVNKKHPFDGALLGLTWGLVKTLPRAEFTKLGGRDITEWTRDTLGMIRTRRYEADLTSRAIETLVPNPERRAQISDKLERGDFSGMTPDEVSAGRAYRQMMSAWGQAAKDVNLIKGLIKDYVTHIAEKDNVPASQAEAVVRELFGEGQGTGTSTRFAKSRRWATFDEFAKAAEERGLRVKTRDLAEITRIYGWSMAKALENKAYIENLKKATPETGQAFIQTDDKAPATYVAVNHPQMNGLRVHPELAPHMKFLLESHTPGMMMRGLLAASMAQKRLVTSLSLFHANNLLFAYAGAMGTSGKVISGLRSAMDAYMNNDPRVRILFKNGLENPVAQTPHADVDLRALEHLGDYVDATLSKVPGLESRAFGKAGAGVEKVQRVFDKATWEVVYPRVKMAIALHEFDNALIKHPKMDPNEVARQVSAYANNLTGGLDWYEVATSVQNKFLQNIALHTLSPSGRGIWSILMFAPDWTVSTFRSLYNAIPGTHSGKITKALAQKYALRSALIYAALADGMNLAMSGHHIWQNYSGTGQKRKWEPLTIQTGDGSVIHMDKHFTESAEWVLDPSRLLAAKMGVVPKTGQIITSTDERKSKVEQLARLYTPISLQQTVPGRSFGQSIERSLMSAAGMPKTRMTRSERAAAKRRKELERLRKKESYR